MSNQGKVLLLPSCNSLRADLDGTIFVYGFRMRLLYHALLSSSKDHKQLVILKFLIVATTVVEF